MSVIKSFKTSLNNNTTPCIDASNKLQLLKKRFNLHKTTKLKEQTQLNTKDNANVATRSISFNPYVYAIQQTKNNYSGL